MTAGSATPAAPARLVTGSTLRHVITMTGASAIGLVAVFAVEALSLFYIGLLGQPELTAAMGYSGTLLFFATSVAIGMSIAGSALTARALGRGHRTQANQIAGAALDTFVTEPMPADHPFRGCPNVLLTPHLAGFSRGSGEKVSQVSTQALLDLMRGQRPEFVVNPEVLATPALRVRLGA